MSSDVQLMVTEKLFSFSKDDLALSKTKETEDLEFLQQFEHLIINQRTTRRNRAKEGSVAQEILNMSKEAAKGAIHKIKEGDNNDI